MRRLLMCLVLTFAVIRALDAAPTDGTWEVRLPGGAGRQCSSDILVRLTITQGRLSGVFVGGLGTQTIEGLALKPDGSFAGITSGGAGAGQAMAVWSVAGQFSGNTVSVTATDTAKGCGTRIGQATRSGG
jgi:hypothetical protein